MATAGDQAAGGSAGLMATSGGQAHRPARRPGPGRDVEQCAREPRSARRAPRRVGARQVRAVLPTAPAHRSPHARDARQLPVGRQSRPRAERRARVLARVPARLVGRLPGRLLAAVAGTGAGSVAGSATGAGATGSGAGCSAGTATTGAGSDGSGAGAGAGATAGSAGSAGSAAAGCSAGAVGSAVGASGSAAFLAAAFLAGAFFSAFGSSGCSSRVKPSRWARRRTMSAIGLVERRRVALDGHAEPTTEVDDLLVGHSELFGQLVHS